ncbi:MAG: fasciclin domain-containing protein [Muribaculaceae bacterium]|nr:fasciclin domain-containing protein [Muribaculaceae bacterium]
MKLIPTAQIKAAAAGFLLLPLVCISCRDEYVYDDKAPDNLGASIYDYLRDNGEFTCLVRLIDDLDYKEVLSRTGSKTLFAADDDAFARFFKNNPYGATSYEELTIEQKKKIMNTGMVNMAYLSEMLSNVAGSDGANEGMALRRKASGSYLDELFTSYPGGALPRTPYWNRFSGRNLYMVADAPMLVHFTDKQMATQGMTSDDFSLLHNGESYAAGDIYVNGVRIKERDIICKNGYIHVAEDVVCPLSNMADAIGTAPETTVFSSLLDKFSAPYYNASYTAEVKDYFNGSTPQRPLISGVDSVFVKGYFNERTRPEGPLGESLSSYGMLYYDPADPNYAMNSSEQDMGAMFVPTDKAMNDFINGGKGSYLRDAYGSWDNIPTDILAMFLKNHQKRSFTASLPHSWSVLTDESSYPIDVNASDVERCIMTGNGPVYVVNTVFPPIDYQGVYASVLTDDRMSIMKWAITDDWSNLADTEAMRFYMYLRSMENMYNLLVPTDDAMANYREPISWAIGGAAREIWEFKYVKNLNTVTADVYTADADGNKGTLKRTVTNKRIIRNRLRDIIDTHIIVGTNDGGNLGGYVDDGSARYVLTKGGATIAVSGKESGVKFNGGGDIAAGTPEATVVTGNSGLPCRYESDNGRTFFIDHILHDATASVYDRLAENPEYKAFFDLCRGHDQVLTYFSSDTDVEEIFSSKIGTSSSGLGMVVNSFNNFRYTIFVPTAEALEKAFREDPELYTWEQISADEDYASKKRKTLYLLSFIKYHFMDNSAYISGKAFGPAGYETAARNEYDKFHKVTVESDGSNLKVTGENGRTASVIKTSGSYNVMARDFITDATDYTQATNITASSRAVIHLIDNALGY